MAETAALASAVTNATSSPRSRLVRQKNKISSSPAGSTPSPPNRNPRAFISSRQDAASPGPCTSSVDEDAATLVSTPRCCASSRCTIARFTPRAKAATRFAPSSRSPFDKHRDDAFSPSSSWTTRLGTATRTRGTSRSFFLYARYSPFCASGSEPKRSNSMDRLLSPRLTSAFVSGTTVSSRISEGVAAFATRLGSRDGAEIRGAAAASVRGMGAKGAESALCDPEPVSERVPGQIPGHVPGHATSPSGSSSFPAWPRAAESVRSASRTTSASTSMASPASFPDDRSSSGG
mmetsp:Transcript_6025/g.25591  ORF Transcript_6025/g.25591 Transcript_6025/m.25591 type:complete len:291 (+) Transcript_6025:922-1794(+)